MPAYVPNRQETSNPFRDDEPRDLISGCVSCLALLISAAVVLGLIGWLLKALSNG